VIGLLPIPVAVVLVASLVLALIDVWKLKVYNIFTYPLLVTGLVYQGVVGGAGGLADGLLGCLLGFAVLLPFCVLGGMGGGDVKLLAAFGAWLGPPLTFVLFLASSLAAGLYALLLVVLSGRVRETWLNLQVVWLRLRAIGRYLAADDRLEAEAERPDRRQRVIPFAAMVALGLVGVLVWSRFLHRP
jgi:prepilin peptidase CpaA